MFNRILIFSLFYNYIIFIINEVNKNEFYSGIHFMCFLFSLIMFITIEYKNFLLRKIEEENI